MEFIQLAVNGIALGAAYALVALGFVLILNATGAVNFAQGDLVAAGGFLAVALAGVLPVPGLLLLPLVAILMAGLGLAASAVAYWPLRDRPPVAVFISTIALGIIIQNGLNGLFGAEPRAAPPLIAGNPVEFLGLVIARQSLSIVGVAALLIGGVQLLLTRTQLGRRLRATAQDREVAAALGIPVGTMVAMTFGLAAALAGAAGLLLANQYFITPTHGTDFIVKAYIAVVIGGWGRIGGALAGAMLVAVFETVVAAWADYAVATGLLYAALLTILIFRPQGLFGEAEGRRA
ncbi:MAG: branched-chain amino acid ABC transporter permease [Alphaproteobacteria bacterium]|nr:branched-chain amino acid ABC transporter permease [Alphaproteobacteria bacterium]